MGTGNPSNYTQGDVEAAAKVLTGWRVNGFTSVFDSKQHSTSDKQFSSFYSNAVIKYQAGSDGALETDALIEMIFKKTEAAKRICRAFYRFFVYYAIDANVESTIIAPMAQTLTANNFEVKPVIRELLKSAHFFDALNQGCYIKTPLDFLVGTFKTFDVQVSPAMTVENRYKVYNLIRSYGQFMAQDLGDPPNVAGWPAFHQYPEYYQTWINSDTLPRRLSFTDVMVNTGINVGNANFRIDSIAFAKQCTKPEDPDVLIDFFVELLLALPLSATKKTSLKSILLSNQTSNSYWTVAWNNYIGKQISTDEAILRTRLNPLLLEITRLAEHQLA